MVTAINFTVFKSKIQDGTKRQTIRLLKEDPAQVGEDLHLIWNRGGKDSEVLRIELCRETFCITMRFYKDELDDGNPAWRVQRYAEPRSSSDSWPLMDGEVEELAKRDGFVSTLEMMMFFNTLHPDAMNGDVMLQVIRW